MIIRSGAIRSYLKPDDNLAIAFNNEAELHRVAKDLADARIENTGAKKDETLQKMYVAFKAPDCIQREFYIV